MSSFQRPIVFGEVLFDRFPDGSEVLGGAPFNVAWHLAAFGLDPLLVTRIGDDEPGRRVLEAMARRGLDTAGVQVDPGAPTGTVRVLLDPAGPGFEIPPNQAFDNIDADQALAAAGPAAAALLYHGSLAVRAPASAAALATLREALAVPRFVDVNLRAPWWEADAVRRLAAAAAVIKLNDDELPALLGDAAGGTGGIDALAGRARSVLGADWLVVTLGAEGALVVTADGERLRESPPDDVAVVDTVGAGDALSAVMIAGRLRRWSPGTALRRAVAFASRICGVRGAVPDDPAFYEPTLATWKEPDR